MAEPNTTLQGIIQAGVAELEMPYGALMGTKYVTLIGLVVLLWDYLLTLNAEIRLIWQSTTKWKSAFCVIRYGVLGAIILSTHVTSGFAHNLSDKFCGIWAAFMICYSLLYTGTADLIIVTRVYMLWDCRRHILKTLLIGFIVTYTATFGFGIVTAIDVVDVVIYEPQLYHTCIVTKRPRFLPAIWASQVAFDIYIVMATFLNAADRPRRIQSQLVSSLYRDGLVYFVALFGFRIMLSIISSIPNGDYSLVMPFFVWSMTSLVVSRLLLRMEGMRQAAGALAVPTRQYELTIRREVEISSTI
ncbi:hypothetical protein NEOLEDRAFT_1141009 [Neolentinus lepideus HHB14362 ss-1]|uniref:DUF6533 domain-containing protein n=1 Tax=Neolentinus lepideus HHB14362 ss-1 TaxID=1314782 RepID=A0A165NYI9_9AGAM|nr:hypothetical protein NEOLEDRAFT_1141009 [Neolentinus lepideus HHB14362 ss-1]